MEIDPNLAIAISIHSKPGVYALLLGSGVSRAAQIKTGWEIVLDLVEKISMVRDGKKPEDPEKWCKENYGEPDYSELLSTLAAESGDRTNLLNGYFEPTEVERVEGTKVPTRGHRAIAQLVASGFIRVIVTTNFDRLMEEALEAVGIQPSVISSADRIAQIQPIQHNKCTIVKLHGDYRDTRSLRNTKEELSQYEDSWNSFLRRIFTEYGLVICGWSADWDPALSNILIETNKRLYSTFWGARGKISDKAKRVIEARGARVMNIEGADTLFEDLASNIAALESRLTITQELNSFAAAERLKIYLRTSDADIKLYDFVVAQTEICTKRLSEIDATKAKSDEVLLRSVDDATDVLRSLYANAGYWQDDSISPVWQRCIEQVWIAMKVYQGLHASFAHYPALSIVFTGGVGAVAAENYEWLSSILRTRIRGNSLAALMAGKIRQLTAEFNGELQSHLFKLARSPLEKIILDNDDFESLFSIFEYLLGVVLTHECSEAKSVNVFPVNYYRTMNRFSDVDEAIGARIVQEGGAFAPLILAGGYEKFNNARSVLKSLVSGKS